MHRLSTWVEHAAAWREPVSIWEESGLLRAMYSGDVTKCLFQQQALATRFAPFMMALTTPGVQLVVAERPARGFKGAAGALQHWASWS